MPQLAIVHDDFLDPLRPFQGADVRLWRSMSPASSLYVELPPHSPYTYANEDDDGDRSWRVSYARHVRQFSSCYLVCPAEKPTERNQYNPDEIAACDAIGVHIAVYEDPTAWAFLKAYGKPIWITEVEADPNRPEQLGQLVPAAAAHIAAGAACVFLWGADTYRADANDHPDILAQVRAYNQGGTTVAVDPTIQQVLDQNALIAQAQYDMAKVLEKLAPADPDLQDAKTNINALNPAKFTFP